MKTFYEMTQIIENIAGFGRGADYKLPEDLASIAASKKSIRLPPERKGMVRFIHRMQNRDKRAPEILKNGLRYTVGLFTTTTLGNGSLFPTEGEEDYRFAAGSVILMDIPKADVAYHSIPSNSPGIVSASSILGYYDAENSWKWVPNPRFDPSKSSLPPGWKKEAEQRWANRPMDGHGGDDDDNGAFQVPGQSPDLDSFVF